MHCENKQQVTAGCVVVVVILVVVVVVGLLADLLLIVSRGHVVTVTSLLHSQEVLSLHYLFLTVDWSLFVCERGGAARC